MRASFVITIASVVVFAGASCTLSTEGGLAPSSGSGGQAAAGGTTSSSGTGGTGGTTSGTGGTGGTSSGTGGVGNTGGSAPEDCLDGIDNDGNSLTDCADPACQQDYECVPEAPSNWTGFAYVAMVTLPAPTVAPCPDSAPPDLYYSKPGGPALCDSCNCAGLQGAGCSYPVMSCYESSTNCGGSVDFTASNNDNNCHLLPNSMVNDNQGDSCIRSQASQPNGSGSCAISGGTPTVPPPWGDQAQTCDLSPPFGAGCSSGEVCVPSAGTAYPDICITRDGEHGCPSGWIGYTAYTGADDTRGCSACSCTPQGVSCTAGGATVYDFDNCGTGGDGTVTVGGSCVDISDQSDYNSGAYRLQAGNPQGGSCTPSGGQPTGALTPTGPLTVCCL